MEIVWPRVLPVIISIFVIIAVAVLREYSKTFAAIAATMPINVPLALWIAFSAGDVDQTARIAFAQGLLLGIFPTVLFLIVAFLTVRSGWGLVPTIIAGYIAWGAALLVLLGVRHYLSL
ncbi:MAG: hypothetical protein K8L99_33125 [Anaerolineae bacterium]|nr:hypothetical protein [Anaerolineae bacterium]